MKFVTWLLIKLKLKKKKLLPFLRKPYPNEILHICPECLKKNKFVSLMSVFLDYERGHDRVYWCPTCDYVDPQEGMYSLIDGKDLGTGKLTKITAGYPEVEESTHMHY